MIIDEDAYVELLEDAYKDYIDELIEELDAIGMECVNNAKNKGDYKDKSGNLRGSIGYAVVLDGKQVAGGHGEFLKEVIAENPKGIVFILVAGMNYASDVENGGYRKVFGKMMNTRAYNVLSSAELLADELINELLG